MRVMRQATPGLIDLHPPEDLHQPGGSFRLTLDHGLDQASCMVVVGVVAVHTPNSLYSDFVLLWMSQQRPIREPLWGTVPADAQAALLDAWKSM